MALTRRVRELEAGVAQSKDWMEEKNRYQLRQVGNSGDGTAPVYTLRQEYVQAGEAFHCVCAHCMEDGKKSILRQEPADFETYGAGMVRFFCGRCHDVIPPCPRGEIKR